MSIWKQQISKRGFPNVDEWQYNMMMLVMTARKRKDIMSRSTHNSIARPWIFNVNHTRPMLVGGPGVISWMSHRGERKISSQIDPEVRPCNSSSNPFLLARIYLCLKNVVSNRSEIPPLRKFIQCKYTSWVLPLNHCYVGMPKIGAFCVEPRSSQDVSTDVTKGLHPAPSPIHNSKQTWAQLLFQEIFTWLVFLLHRVFYCSNWYLLLKRLIRPISW